MRSHFNPAIAATQRAVFEAFPFQTHGLAFMPIAAIMQLLHIKVAQQGGVRVICNDDCALYTNLSHMQLYSLLLAIK